MSHTKYTTSAWVIHKLPSGEGSARVLLYTRSFGMLYAFAKSAREHRSRLRYSLEPGTMIDASLIRGRYEWRLASAKERMRPSLRAENARLTRARTLRLLKRLVKGEEANDALFVVLEDTFGATERITTFEEWSGLELLSALRILSRLGYLGDAAVPDDIRLLLNADGYDSGTLQAVHTQRLPLVQAINEAIKASHL